ncbi:hypothetical protein [Devosia sp.]|uniref:hypothetical protein n=1 Tax=Devosia sp. TaxID=1871048 RepID=UPI0032678F03
MDWFAPLWRRLTVTVFLAVWCAWEFFGSKDQFWAGLVGAALLYALYSFFYAFPRRGGKPKSTDTLPPPAPPEA